MNRLYQILLPLLGLFFQWVELTEFLGHRTQVYKIHVLDGDTIFVRTQLYAGKLRFMKVDAPEMGQNFLNHEKGAGDYSKDCLKRLLRHKKVTVSFSHRDMYQRMLGEVYLGETSISFLMLEQGCTSLYSMAQFDSKNEKSRYLNAMILAQKNRRGIWKRGGIMSPYYYRKQKKGRSSRPSFNKRIAHRQ